MRVESTQPAMPVSDGNRHADQVVLAVARYRLEYELVRLLVEEEDRRGDGAEDRARHLGDPLQQAVERLARAHDAGGHRRAELALAVRHSEPPTFDDSQEEDALQLERDQLRVLREDEGEMPAMCGVAKLLPEALIFDPPGQATSTPTPRPKNSTGGFGL